jgi:hypothetical protein
MNLRRSSLLFGILALTALGLTPRDLAAQPPALGPETRVDTLLGRHPACPKVDVSRKGGAAEIAWDYGGLPPFDVYVRHYAPDGGVTDPQQIPMRLAGTAAAFPEVEALTTISYGFRVLSRFGDGTAASPLKFYRQKLAQDGHPYGDAPRPVGGADTLWVWPGEGDVLYAGSYRADKKQLVIQQVGGTGQPTGPQTVVNTRPIVDPHPTMVPVSKTNEVVMVWRGLSVAAPGAPARQVIRGRRFFKGKPEGGKDFDVNVQPGGAPGQAPFIGQDFVLATDGSVGGFAVAWSVTDAAGTTIHVRFFDFQGVPRGPEQTVVPAGDGVAPVAADLNDSGRLFLLYRKAQPSGSGSDLWGQLLLAADGSRSGPAFPIASDASAAFSDQPCGDVSFAADSWAVTWEGQKPNGGPSGIFLRYFDKQ